MTRKLAEHLTVNSLQLSDIVLTRTAVATMEIKVSAFKKDAVMCLISSMECAKLA